MQNKLRIPQQIRQTLLNFLYDEYIYFLLREQGEFENPPRYTRWLRIISCQLKMHGSRVLLHRCLPCLQSHSVHAYRVMQVRSR